MGIDRLHGWIVPLNVKHYLINYQADNILSFFSVEGQNNRTRAI